MRKFSVLVCDDSALMRRTLKKIVESDPKLYVVGTARDGDDSVNKARELQPDVVTMDVNMPGMDGITALQIIVDEKIAPVLMISSLTQEGAEATFESMALGAYDYVPKPGGTVTVQMGSVVHEIVTKIKAAARARPGVMSRLARRKFGEVKAHVIRKPRRRVAVAPARRKKASDVPRPGFKAVALGISTGGPKTLFEVLPFLPKDLDAAVFVVQHMPAQFIPPYANRIHNNCEMPCRLASPGMAVEPGNIYLGKGGSHLFIIRRPSGKIQLRTPTRPETTFIPSVDAMMDSVLNVFGSDTVGVLMTGMGSDGAAGMEKIMKAGGRTIAESEESATVYGMPKEAVERGAVQVIAPSWEIAERIIEAVENG